MLEFVIFSLIGVLFLAGTLILYFLLRRPKTANTSIYECGMDAEGSPLIGQNIRFYTIGMLFLLFDLEVIFLIPWAIIYRHDPERFFVAGIVFIGILFAALIYLYYSRALKWE